MHNPSQAPFHSIRNESFAAVIHNKGAELKRLVHKDSNTDIIWQGSPDSWTGSAPILFPIVGRLKDGAFLWDGSQFSMPTHGLVRRATWETIEHTESAATFRIRSDASTRQAYPFDWELSAKFTLTQEGIRVDYRVVNTDAKPMLFSMGSHPAFNIPFAGGKLEDYQICFEHPETFKAYRISDELLSPVSYPVANKDNAIGLTRTLFNDDALIFKNIRSRRIHLANRLNSTRITLRTGGAPDLGIWAKPGAPFVCLEPWFGYDDSPDVTGYLNEKPGILTLPGGKQFDAHYEIEFSMG